MSALKSSDKSTDVLTFLRARRSSLAKTLSGPGPSEDQLKEILEVASRVPDHRKLAPFRFLTFSGDARADFGKHLGAIFSHNYPNLPIDRTLFEAERFMRAPIVVAVISSPKDCARGTPEWEQRLVSGAVCFQALLAARAMGYAAQWLTEWYAYDKDVDKVLGLSETEKVAGFIYIGTSEEDPNPRPRPDVRALTQAWRDS